MDQQREEPLQRQQQQQHQAAAVIPLVITALPSVISMVKEIASFMETLQKPTTTPEEAKAALDRVQAQLDITADRVAAVQFRDVPISPEGMPKQ